MPSSLLSISPLDGRYQPKLLNLNTIVSEYGLIRYRVLVELAWVKALIKAELVNSSCFNTEKALKALEKIAADFDENAAHQVKAIEKTTNHDVKAVEYFLQQQFEADAELKPLIPWIHFACTSEDINNTSYAMMLNDAKVVLSDMLQQLIALLDDKATEYADAAMLAHTHGQPASPTTLGKELKNFAMRLQRQAAQLERFTAMAKFNGAVGNYNAHLVAVSQHDWPATCQAFIESLGLDFQAYSTQIEPHDQIAEIMHIVVRCNSILIDLARDCWQYISMGFFVQQKKAGEVGSSTMPHKINPIDFENAEGNAGLAIAMAEHMATKLPVSRLQRDLSDSTVLRNIGSVFAYSVLALSSCLKGLNKVSANATTMVKVLNEHWELLAEPIQTVMRQYGIVDAYEQLKAFTRGEKITQQMIHDFIAELDIPEPRKAELLALTPATYTGLAATLARGQ